MLRNLLAALVLSLTYFSSFSQDVYFTLDPTLTPDGKEVIFSFEGDLWKVSSEGGNAVRLTGMDGDETLPRVSPDGKLLAFSSNQYGNKDVYLMPLSGGEISQLTFHDGTDDVDSWTWDSKNLYITSNRSNRYTGYKVNASGGTPTRLFSNYFNTVHNVVEHPTSGELFFNETWESKNFAHRKRYKGDYNPDIKSYNVDTKEFKKYTDYRGKDFWTTIAKNGNIYFASDEGNNEYNLYTFKDGNKTSLTNFPTSIGRPQVSADGNLIVFSKDYQIFIYDVGSNQTKKLEIKLVTNSTLSKMQDFKISGNVSNFDVSPDGKKMAFVSRGELFVSDIKGKFINQIKTNSRERVVEVLWLEDNRTILYNQTSNGYLNLFTVSADGKGNEKQHTFDSRNNVSITLDKEKKQAVYISGRDELRLFDLSTYSSEIVVKDEFWALYAPQPYFSPDGKYILYNAIRDFERDVFVYHIPSKKIINLTKTGVTESNAFWSPDGKYVFFESDLTKPSYPFGLNSSNIYQMALNKYDDPYRSDKFNELFVEEEDEEADTKSKKKKKGSDEAKDEKEDEIKVEIDEVGLMDRLESIGKTFGRQSQPVVYSKDESTYIFYLSNHEGGSTKLWKTTMKPFEEPKTEQVGKKNIYGYHIVAANDKYYILFGGDIHTLNIESCKTENIELDFKFRRNLSDEFDQMFYEAWAGFEENFYDDDFHGEDWKKLRNHYSSFLPYVSERKHLRLLLNDMLGELNTSHFGFYSNGKEEDKYYGTRTLATGLLFSEADPYKIEAIVDDGPADKVNKDIRVGDRVVEINGRNVDQAKNREAYFAGPSMDQELNLTLDRAGKKIEVSLHPISSGRMRSLLYDGWVDNNQEYVDSKSSKRIAYVHMKNMGGGELNNFKREMVSEANNKDALILDLRNNTGGNVHDEVLKFLSQKPYLQWKYRNGALTGQPNFGPAAKPIVILINEQSLSDAEMTTAGFKALGLGTVIGTETYRWIIFTSGKGLVDGSFYRLPSWGCYTLDGKNLEKEGVAPDIYVNETFTDRLTNKQPQLDKAIDEIMKLLEN